MRKKLIILRGISGAGKSSLTQDIVNKCLKRGLKPIVCSTDNYFMINGEYKFDQTRLKENHRLNLIRAVELLSGNSVECDQVIVDNTNTTFNEFKPYILAALAVGADIEIIEPSTEWKYNVEECFKRNTHGVPKETIQRMLDRWESTSECLLKINQLQTFIRTI